MDDHGGGKLSSIRVLSLGDCSQEVKEQFSRTALNFRDDDFELFLNTNDDKRKHGSS